MTSAIRAIAALFAIAIMASGCVIIVDKDDDDGKTGVSIKSIDDVNIDTNED